jgi:hypothetical protein
MSTKQPTDTYAREEHFKWAFARVIEYLKRGDCMNAKMSFISDYNKDGHIESYNPLLNMIIQFAPNNPHEIIKAIAGLGEAPSDIKVFYDNPQLALQ